ISVKTRCIRASSNKSHAWGGPDGGIGESAKCGNMAGGVSTITWVTSTVTNVRAASGVSGVWLLVGMVAMWSAALGHDSYDRTGVAPIAGNEMLDKVRCT